jgi:hypothetical protein
MGVSGKWELGARQNNVSHSIFLFAKRMLCENSEKQRCVVSGAAAKLLQLIEKEGLDAIVV